MFKRQRRNCCSFSSSFRHHHRRRRSWPADDVNDDDDDRAVEATPNAAKDTAHPIANDDTMLFVLDLVFAEEEDA